MGTRNEGLRNDPCWFHVTTHTYGAWLYGDARGFRTRHHREHVEGDYKNPPPPGKYAEQERRSRAALKQPPVVLPLEWRKTLGEALRDRLLELGAVLLGVSVSGQHVHYLAKIPYLFPRKWTGFAKKHAWHVANDRGWEGELWAKRSKATPVKDRAHQLNVLTYILRHADEGAWVWDFRTKEPPAAPAADAPPEQPPPEAPAPQSPPVATGGL